MSTPSPWQRPPAQRQSIARVYLWLGLLIAIAALAIGLFRLFPEVTLNGYDRAQFFYLVAFLMLLMSSAVFARRFKLRDTLRNLAIWTGIAAVLVLGYSFRGELKAVADRVRSEFLPAEPLEADAGTVVLTETDSGDFEATGTVNGVRVRFAIDTGASDIVLSPDDARRAGIDTAGLSYDREAATANGVGHSAAITLDSLAVGPLRFANVPAQVNATPLAMSLLGMAFLRRMRSFEFRGHKLYLRWR